jgi:hypothetical protein
MSVRVENRLTFIHIGKNAGKSIIKTLDKNFMTKHSERQHDTYHELPEDWKNGVFCVIRNPFDRLLSLYHFSIKKYKKTKEERKKSKKLLELGFENFVLDQHTGDLFDIYHMWESNTQFRYLPKNTSNINILRFENLNNDWKKFCMEHGLTYHELSHINSSRDDHSYRDYYNKRMIETVTKKWNRDLALGNYTF